LNLELGVSATWQGNVWQGNKTANDAKDENGDGEILTAKNAGNTKEGEGVF